MGFINQQGVFEHMKCQYGKCPKISYTNVSDKMAYANSADLDKIFLLKEQSDQGLHCLPFH